MDRNDLHRIAKSYLKGTATPEEKELLHQWYDTVHNGEQVEIVSLKSSKTEAGIKQELLEKILKKVKQEKLGEIKSRGNSALIKKMAVIISAAAAVLLAAFGVEWYFNRTGAKGSGGNGIEMVSVNAKKTTKITLPDSSVVWLSAHTVFKYPNSFTGKVRGVELIEGRAFFDVRHQNNHPFFVKTKSLNITVLGTSFDVYTREREGTTKVSVITGKVGITLPGHTDEPAIMLLPKQRAVLNTVSSHIIKEPTPEPVVNLWCKAPLVFDQENLDNVFKAIEKQYNTHIEVADKKLLDERISITLGNQQLDTIMEILSFTKNFKYQIANDSTVVIR